MSMQHFQQSNQSTSSFVDNNIEASFALPDQRHDNASSYSISSMQQQQLLDPLPVPVYSVPLDQLNNADISNPAPSADITHHNASTVTDRVNYQTRHSNSATPSTLVSFVGSTTNAAGGKTMKRCRIQGCK